jgi:hypothetical protein
MNGKWQMADGVGQMAMEKGEMEREWDPFTIPFPLSHFPLALREGRRRRGRLDISTAFWIVVF